MESDCSWWKTGRHISVDRLRPSLCKEHGEGRGYHPAVSEHFENARKVREPVWIDEFEALSIHGRLVAVYSGLSGIRDEGMLQSDVSKAETDLLL